MTETGGRALTEASPALHRPLTIAPDHQGMRPAPHSFRPRLAVGLATLSAGLLLAGCTGGEEPATSRPGVVADPAPITAPEQSATATGAEPSATSTTHPVSTSPRPVATAAAPSAVTTAELDQSLAGLDRDLADLDDQLTDADHDVATPEGDIR